MKKWVTAMAATATLAVVAGLGVHASSNRSAAEAPSVGAAKTTSSSIHLAIVTPYMTAPATNEMVTQLQADAKKRGWQTTLVTSNGDIPTIANKFDDILNQKPSAVVVVSTDLHLLQPQIQHANKDHVPVFGLDNNWISGTEQTVSSNSVQMSDTITNYLFKKLNYKGNIVVLTYTPQPQVNLRTQEMLRLAKQHPGLHIIATQQIDVSSMVESGREIMSSLLTANPKAGQINAVWCGWDEPAIGATEAIQSAHRTGIYVTGMDGASQAVSLIQKGSPFIGTIKQEFQAASDLLVKDMGDYFSKGSVSSHQVYAPISLITKNSK